jgi:hypothetical protein
MSQDSESMKIVFYNSNPESPPSSPLKSDSSSSSESSASSPSHSPPLSPFKLSSDDENSTQEREFQLAFVQKLREISELESAAAQQMREIEWLKSDLDKKMLEQRNLIYEESTLDNLQVASLLW